MVISGDLKNLIGRVERVAEDGKVDIMPKMEGLTDILTFDLNQLEKYFEVRSEPGIMFYCSEEQLRLGRVAEASNLQECHATSSSHGFEIRLLRYNSMV